jgi:hypothetical protein
MQSQLREIVAESVGVMVKFFDMFDVPSSGGEVNYDRRRALVAGATANVTDLEYERPPPPFRIELQIVSAIRPNPS